MAVTKSSSAALGHQDSDLTEQPQDDRNGP